MKAMILGGVAPHIELIKALKRRGYQTILVDYLENPPARKYADRFCRISTLDRDAVYALAVEAKIDLIISICVDHANVTMCYVAEKLGLPLPYSYKTAIYATDKGLMKQCMVDNDIPTSDFVVIKKGQEIPESISFPAVLKPVDNNGSKGVRRINNLDQLCESIEESFSFSRKGEVIIEGFNEGIEIQVDCFANNGKAHVIMTRQKIELPRRDGFAMQVFGSIVPAKLSCELELRIAEIAQKMASGFGFEHTPFFFQAVVKENDIKVLELTPRIGGGLSYKMLKRQTDFNVVDVIIQSYFGNVEEVVFQGKKQYMLTNIIYAADGVFDKVSGIEEMISSHVIEDFDLMAEKGKKVGNTMDSRNRIGAYYIVEKDYQRLLKKAKMAYENIDVIGVDGKSIQCKGFYFKG